MIIPKEKIDYVLHFDDGEKCFDCIKNSIER